MRKVFLFIGLISILAGCIDDEVQDQPVINFYPALAMNAVEDDGVTYTVQLDASRLLNSESTLEVEVVNGDFLSTTPAMSGNRIALTIDAGDNSVSFTVRALDDNLPSSYSAFFNIVEVSGGLKSIGKNRSFILFVTDDDQEVIFEDDFESRNLDKWTTYDVAGSNDWHIDDFADDYYAICSNFLSDVPADDWLIGPDINFDDYAAERLSFSTLTAFNDANNLEVVVLLNYEGGAPSSVSKITLEPVLDPHRGAGFGDFTVSGELDLSAVSGVGNIAFHFKALDLSDGAQWQVNDVLLTGVNLSGGGGGGGGGGSAFNLPFNDDFEDCTEDFVTPSNFIEEFGPGSKTDRGWGCRQEGVGGGRAVRASAFGGTSGFDDAWLINNKPFDLSALSEAWIRFDAKSQFDGDGDLTVLWSSDYPGSGDPTASTWTELTDIPSQLPARGSATYTEVISDWSDATGSQAYLAFRFEGGTDGNSASFEIDNIEITENEPFGGGGGGGGGGSGIFSEDFTSCVNVNSFNEFSVTGDQVWSCTDFGQSGQGARMNSFDGQNFENEDWMISPAIDLSGLGSASLEFFTDVSFNGPVLQVMIATDYAGSGDPTGASWDMLSPVLDTDSGNDTWTSSGVLNLSAYLGSSIYIAFVYNSTVSEGARWTVDDVVVSGE